MEINIKYALEDARLNAAECDKLEQLLEYPEVQADKKQYLRILDKRNNLKPIKDAYDSLKKISDNIVLCEKELNNLLESDRAIYLEEINRLTLEANVYVKKIRDFLSSSNITTTSTMVELRSGKLDETKELISSVMDSIAEYTSLCGYQFKKIKTTMDGNNLPKLITLQVIGPEAFNKLSLLNGTHKVNLGGKKDASKIDSISITVYEIKDEKIQILDKDLRIDLFHSSGAGGQNINKVETAIRITHLPTGIVVSCQDERSQLRNKERAINTLKEKLMELNKKEETQYIDKIRKKTTDKKNKTNISFNLESATLIDTRLKANINTYAIPISGNDLSTYLDNLTIAIKG